MANLSQIKRQRMLAFLDTIRQEHKDDDGVLAAINEIETELNAKKYGLVWEEHEEAVDVQMRNNIPVFTECKDKEITTAPGGVYNFILEGDNLHSLRLLEKTHAGKIDVIYIDPPYNTGSKDFVYDDALVDSLDGYRHSKWLSFMKNRLEMAHKLLKENGFIFVSINDIELYALKMLCDEIFGENNYLANMIWQSTPGSNTGEDVKTVTEYVLLYAKDKQSCKIATQEIADTEKYKNQDEYFSSRGGYVLNKLDRRMTGQHYSEALNYAITAPDGEKIFPGSSNVKLEHWNWRWSSSKVEWGIKEGFIVFKKNKGKWSIYFKQYEKVNNENQPISRTLPYQNLMNIDGANSARGTREVMDIFSRKAFDYPKPLNLLLHLLKMSPNNDCTVLDFFAGSGTTGHAVLKLNAEDGGNRHFILCTNNENNICEEVTYERIKRVINGYGDTEGIPANLKYYRTDFVPKNEEYLSDALLEHIAEMIQLEHGIKLDGQNYIMVLDDEEVDELAAHWSEYPDVKALYISKDVLLTTEQNALFKDVEIHIIPDYYFNFELREVGETW